MVRGGRGGAEPGADSVVVDVHCGGAGDGGGDRGSVARGDHDAIEVDADVGVVKLLPLIAEAACDLGRVEREVPN